MKQTFTRFYHSTSIFVCWALFIALVAAPSLLSAQRFVHSGGNCGVNAPCYTSLQAAITAAAAGETITVLSSLTEGKVTVNKSLTINGGGFVLTSTSNDYGLVISATNVTIQNFAVEEAGTFGIMATPGFSGLILSSVGANDNGRLVPMNGTSGSGIAITGVSNATLTNITATGNKGNGISITASQQVMITNLTTFDNAFLHGLLSQRGAILKRQL
jgi:parallel beta-helix repeat protein